ncbi:MAG: adenosylcobinamide-GDP ribazoletransferase [Methanosarcinales archaeon Met12]|nr:MAG: adenosylcobinamide-GDP ribazoletransferase [Methanosarcinales archaeon Met12]
MNDLLHAIKAGMGFLTTIPVGIDMDGLQKLGKRTYLLPFIGALIGLIIGSIGLALQHLPPYLSLALLILALYCITGLNHMDGLMDFGDAITAHGTPEERIRIMHDTTTGVGGTVFCVMSLLILFSAIAAIEQNLLFAILIAEISAKQSMLTAAMFGKSIHKGLGSIFIDNVRHRDFLIGLVFSCAICWLAFDVFGIIALLSALLSALVIVHIASRNFGGVNGDVLGATNEVGRIAGLIAIGVMTWMPL